VKASASIVISRSTTLANLALAGLAILLGACASHPPGPARIPEASEQPSARSATRPSPSDFERRVREQALAQTSQSKLSEAAVSWEILVVLRPDEAEYHARLAQTRLLIDRKVSGHLERGALAARRGALDEAEQYYLAALALEPDNAAAAEALRDVERERVRRHVLGRPARTLQPLRATRQGVPGTPTPASGLGPLD